MSRKVARPKRGKGSPLSEITKAQSKASRLNGAKGGRPRAYPPCPHYGRIDESARHRFVRGSSACCGCGFDKETGLFPKGEWKAKPVGRPSTI